MPKVERPDMNRVSFTFQYTGEALAGGGMNIRELAPSLLALGDLCDQVNFEVNGGDAKAEVEIKATAPGSFIIEFSLAVSIVAAISSALELRPIKAAAGVFEMVKDLIDVVKVIRGRKVTDVTQVGDGTTRLEIEHTIQHDVSDRLFSLLKKKSVQRDVQTIASPLKSDGIDGLSILQRGHIVESINDDDLASFEALPSVLPTQEQELIETTSTVEKWFKVITVSSDARFHWKLYDGTNTFSVKVDDVTLLQNAKNGHLGIEPGFVVKAQIKSDTRFENGEPRTENHLLTVSEIKPPHDITEKPWV